MSLFAHLAAKTRCLADEFQALADDEAARTALLDGFRPGSKTRDAAIIMTAHAGEWLSRRFIASLSGARANQITTVGARLTLNGCVVERRVAFGEAQYRVTLPERAA